MINDAEFSIYLFMDLIGGTMRQSYLPEIRELKDGSGDAYS